MSPPRRDAPTNLASLQARVRNVAQERGQQPRRIQRAVASTVVGQMLPDGVVKGGTAMKIRVGEAGSRYTPDFDASRSRNVTVDDYVERLRDKLERGWSGFTGTVSVLEPRQVEDVPPDYVMQPFEIRLAYQGRHWLTVELELGHDEVGSTEDSDLRIADDILEIFATIGLEAPAPIPLMSVEHQIAQKLHACTYVNPNTTAMSERTTSSTCRSSDRKRRSTTQSSARSAPASSPPDAHTNGRPPSSSTTTGTRSTQKPPKGSTSFRPSLRRLPGRTTWSFAPVADRPANERPGACRAFLSVANREIATVAARRGCSAMLLLGCRPPSLNTPLPVRERRRVAAAHFGPISPVSTLNNSIAPWGDASTRTAPCSATIRSGPVTPCGR
jgi:hypothetical protein